MEHISNLLQRATNALNESNCKTLVAFSNHPDYHDIFVECVNNGIIDELPYETDSVTYEDCLKVLNKANSRRELQRKYRRHYQVIANVDGLLDKTFGLDKEGGVDELHMIPEFAFYLSEYDKSSKKYDDERQVYVNILRERQKAYRESNFNVWEMEQSFRTKEEAIDYVLLIAKLYGGPKLSIKCMKRPELRKIINMAFYLGCLNKIIKDENNYYECILNTLNQMPQHKHLKDFLKYNNSHFDISSLIDGMLDAFFPEYDSLKHTKGFWDIYDNRYIAAKTCFSLKEYRKHFPTAHQISKTNKELDNFTWFKYIEFNDDNIKNNIVYVYIDNVPNKENKPIAYVGRTLDYSRRNYDHQNLKEDSVYKYFNSLGRDVPEMLILKTNLTLSESRYFEDYYLHFYKNNGYYMINSGVTGINSSSIGGGMRIWNYGNTYIEALKYTFLSDFQKNSCGAYTAALHKHWLDDYYWLIRKKSNKRSYEECYNVAQKYDTLAKFCKQERKIYDSAKDSGWIDDYYWLKRSNKESWPRERCFEESKKYNTILELKRDKPALLDAIYRNDWLKEMPWLKKTRITLNDYDALLKASEYKTRLDLVHKNLNLYQVLYRRKLLKVIYDENDILRSDVKNIIETYKR